MADLPRWPLQLHAGVGGSALQPPLWLWLSNPQRHLHPGTAEALHCLHTSRVSIEKVTARRFMCVCRLQVSCWQQLALSCCGLDPDASAISPAVS